MHPNGICCYHHDSTPDGLKIQSLNEKLQQAKVTSTRFTPKAKKHDTGMRTWGVEVRVGKTLVGREQDAVLRLNSRPELVVRQARPSLLMHSGDMMSSLAQA